MLASGRPASCWLRGATLEVLLQMSDGCDSSMAPDQQQRCILRATFGEEAPLVKLPTARSNDPAMHCSSTGCAPTFITCLYTV